MGERFARGEERGIEGGVLVNRYRRGVHRAVLRAVSGCRDKHRQPAVAPLGFRKAGLFNRWLETAAARDDPHLDEAHRLRLRAIAFGMLPARTQRRPLDRTWWA